MLFKGTAFLTEAGWRRKFLGFFRWIHVPSSSLAALRARCAQTFPPEASVFCPATPVYALTSREPTWICQSSSCLSNTELAARGSETNLHSTVARRSGGRSKTSQPAHLGPLRLHNSYLLANQPGHLHALGEVPLGVDLRHAKLTVAEYHLRRLQAVVFADFGGCGVT